MERSVLKREIKNISTSIARADIKICILESGKHIYPEYNSVVELCKTNHMTFREVYDLIKKESEEAEVC